MSNSSVHGATRWWRIAVVTASLVLAACTASEHKEKFQASDVTGADWGRDFHLVDPAGTPRSLADYRGKVVMMFFGYTNCPDACPTTLAKMAQAVDRLGPDGKRVQGLFVTVDPVRDVPAVLAQYVPSFNPTFVGLSGDPPTIAATAKDFKVYYKRVDGKEPGSYFMEHTAASFIYDPQGKLRLYSRYGSGAQALADDLKLLLQEQA